MRVLIYHNILWPKHIGAVFSELYALCKDSGIDASIVHLAETQNMRVGLSEVDHSYHDYPYRVLFRGSYEDVGVVRMTVALIKDLLTHPGDVVVLPGYERIEYWVLLGFCVLMRRRRLVFVDSTGYDRPKNRWKEAAKRMFFARCDGFLCYGTRSREYLLSYAVPSARIYPGCQATALAHGYDAADVQRMYDGAVVEATHAPRYIYVGRLAAEKGLYDLLAAFKTVHARQPAARLDLVGAGPLRDGLETYIAELGLDGAVTLLGTRDISEFAPLFVRSTALVLPSYSEPWGYVVNESLSYGCPVVASDRCGCVPELVVDGVTGFAFSAGNTEALSAAMLAVARLSENRAATARQCLKLMSDFTPARAAQRILRGCQAAAGLAPIQP
jgi:glycosyltransferase involved in cell wall biosynthesis